MKDRVIRYRDRYFYGTLYFLEDGNIVTVGLKKIKKEYGVDSVIKFFDTDFNLIKRGVKRLTHFNIQYCGHKQGHRYLIMTIKTPGYFDGKAEMPPVLNRRPFLIAKCLSVRNNVHYDDLVENDFKHSLENITDAGSLKKSILRRYKKSLAHLSDRQKLLLGVAITELEVVEKI